MRSAYRPELFDREGVLVAIGLFVLPFVLLWLFDRVLPIEPSAPPPPAPRPPEAPEVEPAGGTA
jgi:hypothetical protein